MITFGGWLTRIRADRLGFFLIARLDPVIEFTRKGYYVCIWKLLLDSFDGNINFFNCRTLIFILDWFFPGERQIELLTFKLDLVLYQINFLPLFVQSDSLQEIRIFLYKNRISINIILIFTLIKLTIIVPLSTNHFLLKWCKHNSINLNPSQFCFLKMRVYDRLYKTFHCSIVCHFGRISQPSNLHHFIILLIMGRTKQQQEESEVDSEQQQKEQQKPQIRKPKIDRLDKFKSLKKIIINVSMTQYPVVVQAAEHLDWKIQNSNDAGDWDVFWTDFSIDPDVLIKMHLFQKISHYPGIHVIARKNLLGLNLMSLRNKFPEQYNFFPLTWMLPLQYAQFRAYYQTKPKGKARTYIAKPQAECQGRGIFLTRKIEDLQNGKHYVVQRYLARPYLLDGLKFDLRIYVLLCGTNPLRLYMYNEGLGRLATQPYVQPTTSNLQKQYIHLTNYAINKHNPKFVFNNSSKNMGVGHKRSVTSVFKQLEANGVNIKELKEKINDVAIKTIICGLPLMSHQYKCSQPEDYTGNMCFHILGLDIMLNNLAEPILLEVNHTPSFTTDTPLDHKIKFNLIKDTLKLMNINVQTKNQLFNKVKELNSQRLITGKRHILQGQQRQQAIRQAQRLRDTYQDKNLGGFKRIFPIEDEQKMKKYNTIIQTATKSYFEQNSSVRMKMMQKQAKKLTRLDQKTSRQVSIDKRQKLSYEGLINKTNSLIRNVSHHQNKSFSSNKQPQPHLQYLTKSEYKINIPNDLENHSQLISPLCLEKEATNSPNSLIKIKRCQPISHIEHQRIVQRPYKVNRQVKSTPIANLNSSPITQSIFNHKQILINHSLIKNFSKKPNPSLNNQYFPIIAQAYVINQFQNTQKKDNKFYSLSKHQNMIKASIKTAKIYDQISKDMKNLIDKKTNFVMPKLINTNVNSQKRQGQTPIHSKPSTKDGAQSANE